MARILQKACLAFPKDTWADALVGVEQKYETLILRKTFSQEHNQQFVKFPHNLLPPGENVKAVVLMAARCYEALARVRFLGSK